ncbi:carbamoyltransferase family protein [Enhygromyxa salina]|uniref:Decarbamoylnovobiocin carbamoyltransferase n=1 Tax=Enhygromyxa salina TaxID=215803 RepID=A0A2S9YY34_9BACT|nr:carbamoyltransferase N-terminal domain-containing protein [Enhygromyxa salina]PRQ10001.1 Decarbamoylnovobiocin carbamoyltransferase [Enhygromyxa salina]
MAKVLGISAHYHDAAAALLVDGELVVAIQQERLSRIKNDPGLPLDAADACLAYAGVRGEALDAVVFYERPFDKLERVMVNLMRNLPRTWRQFPRAMASQLGDKIWVLDQLAEAFGQPRANVRCFAHHQCHAASAHFVSRFEDSAVLVVDGVGEHSSTTLWHGQGAQLRALCSIEFPHSLGLLYAALTAWLGFAVNEGEYKVMGLAAWGRPGHAGLRERFERLIRLHDDGSYELGLDYFAHMSDAELGFGPKLEALLGPRRPPGLAWALEGERDQHYADVAATLQQVIEDALLGLARKAKALTGSPNLCLAGGVALNSLANARLAREGGFEAVFVQPAAGDAGGALGAAILAALELGDPRPTPMLSAALGLPVDIERAWAVARELELPVRRVDDPASAAAELIAADKIVAHVRGRFEWGPRALGQRSILASAAARETRERINRLIKQREPFRPFAPAVLEPRIGEYFDGQANDMTPFMTTVLPARADRSDALGAVTHEDGSSRVQTVSPAGAPELHELLVALERGGHAPLVLNTSLNGPGEPIVASSEDALGFFLRHAVDAMMIEDLVIERPA